MKAKLIKVDNGWVLMIDNIMYATDNDKLSLKNCQAIERGYDLDEIVEQTKNTLEDCRISSYESFKIGFQKAFELMGDKKFSADEIIKAYNKGWSLNYDYFQSLQQTEWDVEIVTFTEDDLKSVSEDWGKLGKPKLDTDGCLILKTFKSE